MYLHMHVRLQWLGQGQGDALCRGGGEGGGGLGGWEGGEGGGGVGRESQGGASTLQTRL
jgi:hypothetical protein